MAALRLAALLLGMSLLCAGLEWSVLKGVGLL